MDYLASCAHRDGRHRWQEGEQTIDPCQLGSFIYSRGQELPAGHRAAWRGGLKALGTTMPYLAAMALDESPYTGDLDACIYQGARAFGPASGGNHRMLAGVLAGWPVLVGDVNIYEVEFDPAINTAFASVYGRAKQAGLVLDAARVGTDDLGAVIQLAGQDITAVLGRAPRASISLQELLRHAQPPPPAPRRWWRR